MAITQPPQPATPGQSANALVTAKAQGVTPSAGLPGTAATPVSNLAQQLTSQITGGLNNFKAAAVPTPTPAPFVSTPAPAPNPLMFSPTAQTPGVGNLTGMTADATPMMAALEKQTTQMAQRGTLTGMPNYGQLWSGLASMQNAINNGVFTPADQSKAAGQASEMGTQAAISANQLAQRQTQEFNSEQAAAQRMAAMLLNSANIERLRAQVGMAPYITQLLLANKMAQNQ